MKKYIFGFLALTSALCASSKYDAAYGKTIRANPWGFSMDDGSIGATIYDPSLNARVFYNAKGDSIGYAKYISDGEFGYYSMDGKFLIKMVINIENRHTNYFDSNGDLFMYATFDENGENYQLFDLKGNLIP